MEDRLYSKDARPPREPKPALDNELWVGGLPAAYATCKALKVLLWETIPGSAGIAQPVVRMVVRKGWRDKKTKGWIGYGFVQFRDAAEAGVHPHTTRRNLISSVSSLTTSVSTCRARMPLGLALLSWAYKRTNGRL